jgi:hypothetical protein
VKRWMLIAVVVAGCKEGKGQRCQIDSDCQDGLVCSSGTSQCVDPAMLGIDATVPDAPKDAPADAPKDATPAD